MKHRIIILDNATFHKGEEIENYDWVTIDWKDLPFCIGGLPRQLHIG